MANMDRMSICSSCAFLCFVFMYDVYFLKYMDILYLKAWFHALLNTGQKFSKEWK